MNDNLQVPLFKHIPIYTPDVNDLETGSMWRHRNGNDYVVIAVANLHADDPERYPKLVVYADEEERLWAKPVARFLSGMTLTEPAKPCLSFDVVGNLKLTSTPGGAEIRTSEGLTLLSCDSWAAGIKSANILRRSPLKWSKGMTVTRAHKAKLLLCLGEPDMTPGRDLEDFWGGVVL